MKKEKKVESKKALFKRILQKIKPETKRSLYTLRGFFYPFKTYRALKLISQHFDNSLDKLDNKHIWKRSFQKYIFQFPERVEIFESFINSSIKMAKKNVNKNNSDLILICVVKNDLERIKMLFKHHREIGIKHFVIIDNNSNDGTFEWLCDQNDTDVYQVKEDFTSFKKYGWINRILSIYGFNKWYLYVDSDELFVYQNYENKDITKLISYIKNKGLDRIGSIMIDMYSDKGIYKQKTEERSIGEEYIYFDSNSYFKYEGIKGTEIKGGPRQRIFSEKGSGGPLLIKHPLFYFREGSIFESAHYIYPYISKTLVLSSLLHYKFLATDLERYKSIAAKGNFADGSKEYKMYMERYMKDHSLNFMYKGTKKYKGSTSLGEIQIIENIKW